MNTLSRRSFMALSGLSAAAAALPSSLRANAPALPKRPNVIYILADDMGVGDVHALWDQCKIKTPNLDGMAAEGMRFTDAHSGSAVCTPTRYGVLTGRYCWRTHLKRGVLMGFDGPLIGSGRMTVASFMKSQGYATAAFGKWHVGMTFPTTDGRRPGPKNTDWKGVIKNAPTDVGFDTFCGIAASLDMPPFIWIKDNRFDGICTTTKRWMRSGPAEAGFEAVNVLPTIAAKTAEYIRARAKEKKPFFAYVPLNGPHTPIVPLPRFRGKSGLNAYGDFCMQIDNAVGHILRAVKESGIEENTIVIFTTDNGCSPQANYPQLLKKGHDPSAARRGHKADIFEGGHRVPMIVRWPAAVKPNTVCDGLVCLTDLMATCADITGGTLPANAGEDSISMLPALLGQPSKRISVIHHSIDGCFALREGNWKLCFCPGSGGWSAPRDAAAAQKKLPPMQLFDLSKDPAETKNVLHDHLDLVSAFTKKLDNFQTSGRSREDASRK